MSVGDVAVTGGKEKSYLVVKDAKESVKVKKGSYKKSFSNCLEIVEK
jgi:hypothetical protein